MPMDSQTTSQINTTTQIPAEIRTYIENLLSDAGITPPDDNLKNQIIDEVYVQLDNFLTTVIIENMPPEHIDEFMKMNEEGRSKQEIEQFMRDKMPNSDEVFAKAFMDFRDLYIGNAGMQDAGEVATQPN